MPTREEMERVLVSAFEKEETRERLTTLTEKLFDTLSQTIPEVPHLVFSSNDEWRLVDGEMLEGLKASTESQRRRIEDIDASGLSGIGYYLANPPEDRSERDTAIDKVLVAWERGFAGGGGVILREASRQLVIARRDELLEDMDSYFESTILGVRSRLGNTLPMLAARKREIDSALEGALSDVARRDLQDQQGALYAEELELRDAIQQRLKIDLVLGAGDHRWASILSYGPEGVVTEAELENIINASIEKLEEREWRPAHDGAPGLFAAMRDDRRYKQNEMRTTAEGMLRTSPTADGEFHVLSPDEVRDPYPHASEHFIDVSTAEDAKVFRDLIIACNYVVHGGEAGLQERNRLRSSDKDAHARAAVEGDVPPQSHALLEALAHCDNFINETKDTENKSVYLDNACDMLSRYLDGSLAEDALPGTSRAILMSSLPDLALGAVAEDEELPRGPGGPA